METSDALPNDWCRSILSELKEIAEPADSPLFHGAVIKSEIGDYREAVFKAQKFAASGHALGQIPQLLYASYASQLADDNDGKTEPTAFSFANGQGGKNLLRDARELIMAIKQLPQNPCGGIRGNTGLPHIGLTIQVPNSKEMRRLIYHPSTSLPSSALASFHLWPARVVHERLDLKENTAQNIFVGRFGKHHWELMLCKPWFVCLSHTCKAR
jgi:hypothetical protein